MSIPCWHRSHLRTRSGFGTSFEKYYDLRLAAQAIALGYETRFAVSAQLIAARRQGRLGHIPRRPITAEKFPLDSTPASNTFASAPARPSRRAENKGFNFAAFGQGTTSGGRKSHPGDR